MAAVERHTPQNVLSGAIGTGAPLFFVFVSFVSKNIKDHFIRDHTNYYLISLLMVVVGIFFGLIYVYNDNKGYPSDRELLINSYLGYMSIYFLYAGIVFWIVIMLAYSASLGIRIFLWLAFGLAPFIFAPFARWIYHGEWGHRDEAQNEGHEQEMVNHNVAEDNNEGRHQDETINQDTGATS